MRQFGLGLVLLLATACGGVGAPQPSPSPVPPIAGAVLVTRANDRGMVHARVGDTIQIALGSDYEWRVDPPDGVVFVADSQEARLEANIESIRNLDKNLKEQNYDIATIPYVLQFNKRDLPTALPTDELYRRLNIKREPTFEAVATTGGGVFDTLKAVARQVLMDLKKR